jgi:hypothetical protein
MEKQSDAEVFTLDKIVSDQNRLEEWKYSKSSE